MVHRCRPDSFARSILLWMTLLLLQENAVRSWIPTLLLSTRYYSNRCRSGRYRLAFSSARPTPITEAELDEWLYIGRQQLQPYYPSFPLDDWQLQAGGAICRGYNVMVSAPTGAGKTLVGEMALRRSLAAQSSGIYTTPLKALSNQKYMELSQVFGRAATGLSTGDVSINHRGARVTVMTTEVYRNIAWRASATKNATEARRRRSHGGPSPDELRDTAVVVLDEFHYMGLPGRGGVWEEAIIVSPPQTQIIGLSATLSNAEALVAWMEYVTGRRTVLIQVPNAQRPVPLRYLFATKDGLYPLFREKDAGPGAPLGLLGYRGDGIPFSASKSKKKRVAGKNGFDPAAADEEKEGKLPKGLQVNPALREAAARRLDRVNRALERFQSRSFRDKDDREDEGYRRGPKVFKRRNVKEEQKERERLLKKEMRRAVPSMYALMVRLQQKDLLPAIFFIFSRNGCDDAARMVYRYLCGTNDVPIDPMAHGEEAALEGAKDHPRRNARSQKPRRRGLQQDAEGRLFRAGSNYASDDMILSSTLYDDDMTVVSDAYAGDAASWVGTDPRSSLLVHGKWDYYAQSGLLSLHQVREAAYRISIFNKDNPEIAFDEDLVEQFLFGIGSHHAGMLPAHKSFVEFLFRNQLLKVVFATETLAAGINMPARTTVICSMAKRVSGGSSMALLDTSNLLQMAGRAGRRGMDTDGTCVLVATPFETHDDAVKILTDPILPISSQFSPSYALCVNLIARGNGELTVAKQLVSKSFAMWERRQAEEDMSDVVNPPEQGLMDETVLASAHDHFVRTLADVFKSLVDQKSAKYDVSRLQGLYEALNDLKNLKKTSKEFVSMVKMREIETVTVAYLEKELALARIKSSASEESDGYLARELFEDAVFSLTRDLETQRRRAALTEREVSKHPFTAIASIASTILAENTVESSRLAVALQRARGETTAEINESPSILTAPELSTYAKSAVVLQRKKRKQTKTNVDETNNSNEITEDAWDDFLSLAKTLMAYGCLSSDVPLNHITNLENRTFDLTPAGVNVGMLSFDNSLWALVAMGGAWDVTWASSELDDFEEAMKQFEGTPAAEETSEQESSSVSSISQVPKPQEEAESLVALLKRMSPSELAGYVSSFVSDDSRGGGSGSSIVETFQRITPLQQLVVQKSLCSLERLVEVQKLFSVDEATRNCNLYVV
jgi:replicative superfamily II helicase